MTALLPGSRAAKHSTPSELPAELAFVARFGTGSDAAGRVGHVVGGRDARFVHRD